MFSSYIFLAQEAALAETMDFHKTMIYEVFGIRAVFLVVATLFLFIALLGNIAAWVPLKKTAQKNFSRAPELFSKDPLLAIELSLIFLYSFITFLFIFSDFEWTKAVNLLFFLVWGLPTIVVFVILQQYLKRAFKFTQTSFLLLYAQREFSKALEKSNEPKAMEWMEVVIETALKGCLKGGLDSAQRALSSILVLLENYLRILSKTESLMSPSEIANLTPLIDRYNYFCIYVCRRLQWIHKNAIREHMDPIAEDALATLGKIALFSVRQYPTLGAVPLAFIVSCAKDAQNNGENDIVIRAAFTLSEVAKSLVAFSRERNESCLGLIRACIFDLETVVKENFKRNKETNPALLMQPFAEIGQVLGEEQYKQVPDRDEILKELRRLLSEFQALEMVIQNTEMPSLSPDTSSSFQEDKPY